MTGFSASLPSRALKLDSETSQSASPRSTFSSLAILASQASITFFSGSRVIAGTWMILGFVTVSRSGRRAFLILTTMEEAKVIAFALSLSFFACSLAAALAKTSSLRFSAFSLAAFALVSFVVLAFSFFSFLEAFFFFFSAEEDSEEDEELEESLEDLLQPLSQIIK